MNTDPRNSARIEQNPLDEIATTAYGLGIVFGIALALLPRLSSSSITIYIMALSGFHFLEYWSTARYNSSKVNKDSFLLYNGHTYILAHLSALVEYFIEFYFFRSYKISNSFRLIQYFGFFLLLVGQIFRTTAMVTAGKSFSHIIETSHNPQHTLVTNGIYSISRHPSYTGFFWWAIGSQLFLLNPLCFFGFLYLLWTFFSQRIRYEESLLISFFKADYLNYKAKTSTLIPFIK
ncbi:protein-S-isoprenylcysteine carboxyl O-methyltransferase [Ascoidea rubescens DSM 1968]|uniref:Protein-S-isoprenylcysteine O-methyltransferase n=1 Tax=Ascoidea rubescens DSM 1968 TaxID=1344418 RepID=A0A1D2VQI6_9ASCO|nr:farnesyl cysteine-carboxyl methyltransferase, mediates the carboxyl methylation step during C-termin [Ascoidea rubescens DSM 1968]ODV63874.1 farnesyl cysteine-carboxyl methyltransferase, mediates the carboxyl methylation step during C-termin [Ascoidea rubescens DSM 1968]